MSLPRFYPIFDHPDWLEMALPLGVDFVQLRIKDRPEAELRELIERGRDLCAEHGATLVVNDHWELAIELQCDWVHLGQEDLDDADILMIREAGLHLGVSTHDMAELERAVDLQPDYIALGPVYPTILKKMKWEQQGLERLTEWKEIIRDVPLVAIGGMSVERAQGAFDAGADIVSAVTDITLNEDPAARIKEWLKATKAKPAPADTGEKSAEDAPEAGEEDPFAPIPLDPALQDPLRDALDEALVEAQENADEAADADEAAAARARARRAARDAKLQEAWKAFDPDGDWDEKE